ncbi:MAG: ATP-binding cassette domain-containing protein [Nitrospirales bacterium]|nr:ATP-binding cassette domain-containing protein [Nitrospirales bacterium]
MSARSTSRFQPWGPFEERSACCEPHPLIRAEKLSLYYGNTPAFEGVSWSIYQGCLTALVGPSGSGKTSFLTCLNRLTDLIPGCRVIGELSLGDLNVFAEQTDVLQLRRQVGMIFQKPNPFPLSIRKNLELPLREYGIIDRGRTDHLIEQTLNDVGLWREVQDRLDVPALRLSGGQQQRLCIARALILSPQVLLMDEPCSALDPLSSGVVEDLIARLRGQYTVVIVTHNLAQARRIADYASLFWVHDGVGQLIEEGPVSQIFETPQHDLTAAYISGVRG